MNTYLFGASGHGKVIKDILNANGVKVQAFVDDNPNVNECAGRQVLHDATGLSPMIVSIGVNRIRKIVVDKLVANAEATTVECASNAIAALAKASKDIPNSGGVWGWLAGDNDLDDFAENLPNVAAGIKGFVDKLGNFGQGKVDSVNAASSLLKEIIPTGLSSL